MRSIVPILLFLLVAPGAGAASPAPPDPPEPTLQPPGWFSQTALAGSYAALYGTAFHLGTRLGLDGDFEVARLESAYVYDLVAHAWVARELAGAMGALHRASPWPGGDPDQWGAWAGSFGPLTAMEILNGFMPRVRLDPYDPLANALGAWLATGGRELAGRHPWMRRVNFQFGYEDLGRAFGPRQASGPAGNLWHDYPNGRFGLGVELGPGSRPWGDVVVTHSITSFELDELRNEFGFGVELRPANWYAGADDIPGLGHLLAGWRWLDERLLMPGLYVELWSVDTGPFSDRQPFTE